MLKMLFSIVASVVPARYRGRWLADADRNVQRGAIISGAVQIAGAFGIFWLNYRQYVHEQMVIASQLVAAKTHSDPSALAMSDFTIGTLALFVYLVRPLSLFLMYMAIEGVVRLTAAVTNSEVLPTVPLAILDLAHSLISERKHELQLGPRIADDVELPKEGGLIIRSCRPKEWTQLTTIRYQDFDYEIANSEAGKKPRQFVYRLRPIPPHKLIRGLHHYDPQELLEKKS